MIPGVTTLNYLAATLKKKKLSAIDRKATHGCHRVRLATSSNIHWRATSLSNLPQLVITIRLIELTLDIKSHTGQF